MKSKHLKKILIMLLATLLLLSGCAGGGEGQDSSDGSESATDSGAPEDGIAIFKDGECCYGSVVYSIKAPESETKIATELHTYLRELDKDIKLKADANYKEAAKEIVVAISSLYPEVEALKEGLRYSDYVIAQVGNKIIVTAISEEGLDAGATKLMKMIASTADKEITDIYVDEIRYEAKYDLSSFTVAGNDIKDYTIVYPEVNKDTDMNYSASAKLWQNYIGGLCGYILPITEDSAEAKDKEILIGSTNREESENNAPDPLTFNISVKGSKLVVNSGVYSSEKLFTTFTSKFISGKSEAALAEGDTVSGSLMTETERPRSEDTDIRVMSSNVLCEGANWNSTKDFLPVQPRLEIFLANLYAYRPDVVSVTEFSALWSDHMEIYLEDGYEIILDEFEDGKRNYSAIIYNTETLTLGESGIVRYSKNDGNTVCRNMAWAEFTVNATGKEFAFISTHWDVEYPQSIEQPEEFNAKIVELSENGTRPVVTGGDMNVRLTGVTYEKLMSYGTVDNAKTVTSNLVNDIATCKDIFVPAGNNPIHTVDHIFITKDAECTMFMTMVENRTVDMSDHNAILADIKF